MLLGHIERRSSNSMTDDVMDYGRFCRAVRSYLDNVKTDDLFAIAAVDVDCFRLFNEIHGRAAGDMVLAETKKILQKYAAQAGGLAGYFGNDDFALFIPWEKINTAQLYKQLISASEGIYKDGFYPSIGVYIIQNTKDLIVDMYDCAVIALDCVRDSFMNHVSVYDYEKHSRKREQYKLLIDARKGLNENEFTFYLQPKCMMDSGKIIGAEALVRWNHSERGLISPAEFIPLLEENHCITLLDRYIWEEVFKWQRALMDEGITPLPCSVNVSRVDFVLTDVADCFIELSGKYQLPPSFIELEITESAFVDTNLSVDHTIGRLRSAGFRVLMDDFGTGSSSLHSLRDLSFDILKTDIRFLDKAGHSRKGVDIMESVLNMASLLGVPMIVEGAETRDQIDDLLSIGCSYAQGYFFHEPMLKEQYKHLISRPHKVDRNEMRSEGNGPFRVSDVLTNNLYSKETLNSIFGAVAFLEAAGDDIRIIKVNDRLQKMIKGLFSGEDVAESFETYLQDKRDDVKRILHVAEMNLIDGNREALVMRGRGGEKLTVFVRVFLLNERDGKKLFYFNVERIEPERSFDDLVFELRDTQERLSFLRAALDRLPNPIFMKDGDARFLFFNDKYAKAFGMRQADYVGKTVLELDYLPENDRKRFQEEDVELIRTESELSYKSDFLFSDEARHFSLYWSTGVHDKRTGRRGLIGEIVDISQEREIQLTLNEANEKLEKMALIDGGTGLFNRTVLNRKEAELCLQEEEDKSCILMCDLDHFKRVNDTFGHTEGDAVLSKFGKILLQECRYDDLPVRYGGEEFLLFLNYDTPEQGKAVAERIRQRCENEIMLPNGEVMTVSIGVAMIDDTLTLIENIANVDKYLYLAKKRGRNCVVTETAGWKKGLWQIS